MVNKYKPFFKLYHYAMAKTYFQNNWIDKYSWVKEDVTN